jgi:hypothetical protein
MATTALTLSDLNCDIDPTEPRIMDAVLAQKLGFKRSDYMPRLIDRNMGELEIHGVVLRQADGKPQKGTKGGRPTLTYWLNEAQALAVCLLAKTPTAIQIRAQVIQVFLAWRRGQFEQAPPYLPALSEAVDQFGVCVDRLNALVSAMPGQAAPKPSIHARLDAVLADALKSAREGLTPIYEPAEMKAKARAVILDAYDAYEHRAREFGAVPSLRLFVVRYNQGRVKLDSDVSTAYQQISFKSMIRWLEARRNGGLAGLEPGWKGHNKALPDTVPGLRETLEDMAPKHKYSARAIQPVLVERGFKSYSIRSLQRWIADLKVTPQP